MGLLGETFTGLVGSDRYGGYNWLSAQRRPLCWVHLKRNFKAFLLRYGEPERIGRDVLDYLTAACAASVRGDPALSLLPAMTVPLDS